MWSGRAANDLQGADGAIGTRALGSTRAGDVVGYSVFAGSTTPLLWHAGSLVELPLSYGSEGIPFAVNDAGQAVGYEQYFVSRLPRPDGAHAVVWQRGGDRALGALPGDSQSVAYGLNQTGVGVGYSQSETGPARAVSFSGGNVSPLGALPGDNSSEAFSVNAGGDAVGYSAEPSNFAAAAFCSGGRVVDLGVAAHDLHSEALSINDHGIAVGDSDRNGFNHHAVLFAAGRAVLLDRRVVNLPDGWRLARATAINNSDVIVGEAIDAAGIHHAVELTPCWVTAVIRLATFERTD